MTDLRNTEDYQFYLEDQKQDNCAAGYDDRYLPYIFAKLPDIKPERQVIDVDEAPTSSKAQAKRRRATKKAAKPKTWQNQNYKVLDVGCREFKGHDYWVNEFNVLPLGIDIGQEGIDVVKDKGIESFMELDAHFMTETLEANTFDLVTAFHSLEHMYDLPRVIGEILTVLKPGGHLICAVPVPCQNLRKGHWVDIPDNETFIAAVSSGGFGAPVYTEFKDSTELRPENELIAVFKKN